MWHDLCKPVNMRICNIERQVFFRRLAGWSRTRRLRRGPGSSFCDVVVGYWPESGERLQPVGVPKGILPSVRGEVPPLGKALSATGPINRTIHPLARPGLLPAFLSGLGEPSWLCFGPWELWRHITPLTY